MEKYQLQRLRLMAIFLATVLCLWLVFSIATHGRVTITNKGDETITVIRVNDDQTLGDMVDVKNGAFLRSGNYVIQNNRAGSQRVAHILVPGWLQSTTITYADIPSVAINRSAALTYENFFTTSSKQPVSFTDLNDYISGYTTHDPTDAFGGKYTDIPLGIDIYSPVITSKGTVVGVTDSTVSEYDFFSKQYTTLYTLETEADATVTDAIRLQRSTSTESNAIGVYEGSKKQLTVLGLGKKYSYKGVKLGSRNGVFDINDTGWVGVTNTANPKQDVKLEDEDKKIPYDLTLYKYGSDTPKTIRIGDASHVGAVALSADGKHVAVEKDSQLWVYDSMSGKVIMTNAFTNTNKLFWHNKKLYSLSTDLGISVFEPSTKQLLSIGLGGDDNLSFSNLTPIGSKFYFTAFDADQSSKLPDGYVIDLTQKSNGVTKELTQKLPYSTSTYDINYLGSTIYIRVKYYSRSGDTPETLSRIESIKQDATQKITSLLSAETVKNTTVVFTR